MNILTNAQQADGSFLTNSFNADGTIQSFYKTTLATSIIGYCTASLNDYQSLAIKNRLCNFLLGQKSSIGSWNYWARETEEASQFSCPDDLDDTFSAYIAFAQCSYGFPNGRSTSQWVKLLTNNENKIGGPYRTWLVTKDSSLSKWQDTDIVVNCVIYYFLKYQNITNKNLERYIKKQIISGTLSSPYYPSKPMVWWLASRTGLGKEILFKNISAFIQTPEFKTISICNKALIACSLFNLDEPVKAESIMLELIQSLSSEKDIMPEKLWADPTKNSHIMYAGSQSLSAAFIIKACEFFLQYKLRIEQKTDPYEHLIRSSVIKKIIHTIKEVSPSVSITNQLIQAIDGPESKTSFLMPYLFWKNLKSGLKNEIALSAVQSLCFATAANWLAYGIFDTIIDKNNDKNLLPIGLNLARTAYLTFIESAPNEQWRFTINSLYKKTDRHIIAHSTLPDLNEQLSSLPLRSIGHAIGPLLITALSGNNPNQPNSQNVLEFMLHFLSMRQLNDDAHDWKEDLLQENLSAVNQLTFMSYQIDHPEAKLKSILEDPDAWIKNLEPYFWEYTIDHLYILIEFHFRQAEKAMANLTLWANTTFLLNYIKPLKQASLTALDEKHLIKEFIYYYRPSKSLHTQRIQ